MNNKQRAERAFRAVHGYEDESSTEECISDLLGDLRHLCEESNYDFDERNEVGRRNYEAERQEDLPLYTVIGVYAENGQRFCEEFRAVDAEAAEDLAGDWAHAESSAEINIAGVVQGPVTLADVVEAGGMSRGDGLNKLKPYTVFGFHDHGGQSFAVDIDALSKRDAITKARQEWAPSVDGGNIIVATVSTRP